MHLIYKSLTILICFIPSITSFGQDLEKSNLLKKIHAGTDARRDSIASAYSSIRDSLANTTNTTEKEKLQQLIDSLDVITEENNAKELLLEFEFIKDNPADPIGLEIMLYKVIRRESLNQFETFKVLFNNLSTQLRESAQGLELRNLLQQIDISKTGSLAPEFDVIDRNGERLNLQSFRNKSYVLLDFWASWCVPCRADFPYLKDLYAKYQSKGFEIINISRDDDVNLWQEAIKKDGINNWRHIATKLNDTKILANYCVFSLPTKVLIDKEGRIIGRWRGGGEANRKELSEILVKFLNNE